MAVWLTMWKGQTWRGEIGVVAAKSKEPETKWSKGLLERFGEVQGNLYLPHPRGKGFGIGSLTYALSIPRFKRRLSPLAP